jgi:hypothetical protein
MLSQAGEGEVSKIATALFTQTGHDAWKDKGDDCAVEHK